MKLRKKRPSTQIIGDHMPGTFALVGEYKDGNEENDFVVHGGERIHDDRFEVVLKKLSRIYENGLSTVIIELDCAKLMDLSKNTVSQNDSKAEIKINAAVAPNQSSYVKSKLIDIIHARTGAILSQFIQSSIPPKVALSPRHNISGIEGLFGVSFSHFIDNNVLHFSSTTDPNQSFCMVAANQENYRNFYIFFINKEYKTNFTIADIPEGFDIDHMLARSNAPSSSWIRIEAIRSNINRSHGGGVEKLNSTSGVVTRRKEVDYHHGSMTWLSAAKLAEIKSPLLASSRGACERLNLLIDYYVGAGYNRELVEAGIKATIYKDQMR